MLVDDKCCPHRQICLLVKWKLFFIHFVMRSIVLFSVGSIIGLDERPEHRAIIANDNFVQCLLIPRYWLIQKQQNAGNVWER